MRSMIITMFVVASSLIGPVAHGMMVPTQSCLIVQQHCETVTDGSSLTVSGTRTIPGHTDTSDTQQPDTRPISHPGNIDSTPPEDPPDRIDAVAVDCESPVTPCTVSTPTPDPDPAPQQDTIPTITLKDLAAFHPAPPALASEPDHTGVAGLPVNLTTPTGAQTLHGTLFDYPVTVQLTPHHYTFTFGDGTSTTTRTPGTTWSAAGNPQFMPTDTSHTYAEPGRYPATITIAYTPVVRIQSTTQTVPGYLTVTSASQTITIYEAHTALVAHTCTENPHAPGC